MMRYYLVLPLLALLLCAAPGLRAQSKDKLKADAQAYIAAEHYADALNTLLRSRQLVKTDEEVRFLVAVCHYQLNQLAEAKGLLDEMTAQKKPPYPESWWYLGKVLHAQQQFAAAAEQYKRYLRTLPADHPNRGMVVEDIRRCDNGVRLLYREPEAVVENMGNKVNTAADEFGPVLSAVRTTQLYFTAVRPGNTGGPRDRQRQPDEKFGQPLADMFTTRLEGGAWQYPTAMHNLLNGPQHEQLVGFGAQGQVLLYFQGWNWERGELFADTFQQNEQRTLKTTPFLGPANSQAGDYQMSLHFDTLLVFASRRPGGYGGLDLYQSSLRDGQWTTPENMGPEINSPFDEATPFLARNGKTLYYSTNNSRLSVGGLDVVRAVYIDEAERWSAPENLGFPINSAGDDAYFSLSRDGFTGFLSSSRKDGYGQRDLYMAYFGKYRQEMDVPVAAPPSYTAPVLAPPTAPTLSTPSTAVTQWTVTGSQAPAWSAAAWLPEVLDALRRDPDFHLVLSYYVPPSAGTQVGAVLHGAMQHLQALGRELAGRGIAAERIFLRALLHPDGHHQVSATLSPPMAGVQRSGIPTIGAHGQAAANIAANRALCYKVQVASVQKAYDNPALNQQLDVMLENAAHLPYLRYTVGAAETYAAALRLQQQCRAAGFSGAYIVPFVYGERVEKNRIQNYLEGFPDLKQYQLR